MHRCIKNRWLSIRGAIWIGSDSSSVRSQLSSGVMRLPQMIMLHSKSDGSVVTWGHLIREIVVL